MSWGFFCCSYTGKIEGERIDFWLIIQNNCNSIVQHILMPKPRMSLFQHGCCNIVILC